MASIVVLAGLSAENERRMERFRAHVERHAENDSPLVEKGLYVGPILKGPEAAMRPTISILISCWDIAVDDLHKFAKDMMGMFHFDGLSVIGLN